MTEKSVPLFLIEGKENVMSPLCLYSFIYLVVEN